MGVDREMRQNSWEIMRLLMGIFMIYGYFSGYFIGINICFIEINGGYDHHEWDMRFVVSQFGIAKLVELDRLTVSSDSNLVESL